MWSGIPTHPTWTRPRLPCWRWPPTKSTNRGSPHGSVRGPDRPRADTFPARGDRLSGLLDAVLGVRCSLRSVVGDTTSSSTPPPSVPAGCSRPTARSPCRTRRSTASTKPSTLRQRRCPSSSHSSVLPLSRQVEHFGPAARALGRHPRHRVVHLRPRGARRVVGPPRAGGPTDGLGPHLRGGALWSGRRV